MSKRSLLLLFLVSCSFAVGARADLIGTTVDIQYHYGSGNSSDIVVVTGGTVATCPGPFNICGFLTGGATRIEIGANTITYMYTGTPATFCCYTINGFDYESLNPGGPLTGVSLSTNIPGLDMSRVSFTSTSVQIYMAGLTVYSPGSDFYQITLN